MHTVEKLNFGIVGAAGRGKDFAAALHAHPAIRIHAICDVRTDELDKAAERFSSLDSDGTRPTPIEKYASFGELLDKSEIDAVIIGTPMQYHAIQAMAALRQNIHVMSEVTAGISIEECQELVRTAQTSNGIYMMAENYTYIRSNVLVRELVGRGLFGEVYYAEGEYLHELKELNEITRWRRTWQTGIDGITYGTHSLGPILQWLSGDRIQKVSCVGSGHHYKDVHGDWYENQDSCVMLCQTAKGGLIKIRVDMLSNRPHAMTNYSLQGTKGCYESARSSIESGKIWLADMCTDPNQWMRLEELEPDYLPEMWRNPPAEALSAGHGGGDYFEILDFVASIIDGVPNPIGIHEAMDMTLPGLISQQSIAQNGAWMDVPDSRSW